MLDPGQLVLFMVLAFIATEGTVEYLFGVMFDKIPKITPLKWLLMYLSMIVGILLAFAYQMDLMAAFGLVSVIPWLGFVITGILLGRGANFINDLWQRFLPTKTGRKELPPYLT